MRRTRKTRRPLKKSLTPRQFEPRVIVTDSLLQDISQIINRKAKGNGAQLKKRLRILKRDQDLIKVVRVAFEEVDNNTIDRFYSRWEKKNPGKTVDDFLKQLDIRYRQIGPEARKLYIDCLKP